MKIESYWFSMINVLPFVMHFALVVYIVWIKVDITTLKTNECVMVSLINDFFRGENNSLFDNMLILESHLVKYDLTTYTPCFLKTY